MAWALAVAALGACAIEPVMRADARPYHHTASGFRNPAGSPEREAGFGDMVSFMWRRFRGDNHPPEVPPGHVVEESRALARLAELEGQDTLTWLGHAAFLIRTGGKTILTDPYLSDYASPTTFAGPHRFVPPGIAIPNLPPIDIVIVSHNHYDHLDVRTLEALPGKERMVVIAPLKLGSYFRERGYGDVRELDWHQSVRLGEVTVTALPAIHFSRRTPFDGNKTLWMSAAIASPTQRLFFSGDTAPGPVFGEIGARYGPFSAALISIGAYLPRVIMKATHTTPEEAVQLGLEVGAHRLVAMHWGTVVLTDEPPFEPPERFAAAARAAGLDEERAWLMKIGETRVLSREWPRN
jgi:L-ascorbate metabolism protein UlaG (beta-lactamase superfamily)